MAEGWTANRDEIVFKEKVDRSKFIKEFETAYVFAIKMFKDVLAKYELEYLLENGQFNDEDVIQASSPYCMHIGEAIITLSYTHRHKFIHFIETNLDTKCPVDYSDETLVVCFCKLFYVDSKKEEFLVVCGFVIELAIFLSVRTQENRFARFAHLFGDLFRFVMQDTFFQNGGWDEVKRQAKPWWYTYRNTLYYQKTSMVSRFVSRQGMIDFHDPLLEHRSELLMQLIELLELDDNPYFGTNFSSYVPIAFNEEVDTQERLSPICTSREEKASTEHSKNP